MSDKPTRPELGQWLDTCSAAKLVSSDAMPDLDLYMDQVITFVKRELGDLALDGADKVVTPAMINNYVKAGIVPRPDKKKYNKEHLAAILTICALKRVMPISDMQHFIGKDCTEALSFYGEFKEIYDKAEADVALRIKAGLEADPGTLRQISLEFAVEAAVLSAFARILIGYINP